MVDFGESLEFPLVVKDAIFEECDYEGYTFIGKTAKKYYPKTLYEYYYFRDHDAYYCMEAWYYGGCSEDEISAGDLEDFDVKKVHYLDVVFDLLPRHVLLNMLSQVPYDLVMMYASETLDMLNE